MGYRHTRDEILDAAVAIAHESGMAAVSFGTVARRLAVADRTVVYYFPSKPVLVTAIVERMGVDLQALLRRAFGDTPLPRDELLARAWPVLASREADPAFRAFFEIVGLAASGTEPYASLAPAVMAGWVDWLAPRVEAATPGQQRTEALAVMVLVDGLLLLRSTAGPRAAARAATAWGITKGPRNG